MANAIAGMGIGTGVTKYIAVYRDDEVKRKQILSTGLKTLLFGTFITSIVIIIVANFFCQSIFDINKYVSLFYVFSITLILFTLNTFLVAVLNGYKVFRKIIAINVVSSLVGLSIDAILLIQFGVYGALLGTILSVTLIAFISFAFVIKSQYFNIDNFRSAFDISSFRNLSKFTI